MHGFELKLFPVEECFEICFFDPGFRNLGKKVEITWKSNTFAITLRTQKSSPGFIHSFHEIKYGTGMEAQQGWRD